MNIHQSRWKTGWIQKLKTGLFTESALNQITTEGQDNQEELEEKSIRNLPQMFRKLSGPIPHIISSFNETLSKTLFSDIATWYVFLNGKKKEEYQLDSHICWRKYQDFSL